MATKYAMITYPGGEPILAETEPKAGMTMVKGHGFAERLMALGCIMTPLVLATPERIEAVEMLLDNSVAAPWLDRELVEMYGASLNVLRAMLGEMRGGNDGQ